ncbi:phosphoadenosine phosphosulfate reductase family protein [Clostridium sp. HBUAS56010]|uniref:phosphoadenosine phosphosulfate reductase domain-containing protein n=1 Tax=Clostridium sp. HBUAS56010 TaxID=2571127 RepID=UPI0011780395|nr:phosphoadenosine phosphosulfate reductase family protein [Clostridium sp. HBUAS56010]
MDNKHSKEDLAHLQSLSLENKIKVTQTRLLEWYVKNDNKCYVSFSGGKDSTVLAYLAAQVCNMLKCKLVLWFSDTGLEFPEVREHVKSFTEWLKDKFPNLEIELAIDYPKDRNGKRILFKDVILKYGYPLISKEISRDVSATKNKPNGKTSQKFQSGSEYHKKYGDSWLLEKWSYLLYTPFKISNQCCNVMKKTPAHKFTGKSGLLPIIGTMASESILRKKEWLQSGCNAFSNKNPSSKPLSFWKEQDIFEYIVKFQIPISSVYGTVFKNDMGFYKTTGYDRTGCMFCGFGCHLEKEQNRFQRMKLTHPKIWEYCMKPVADGGLGMKEVLEYIGVKIE